MAPKKITVVNASGGDTLSKEKLGSQDGYKELLKKKGAAYLVDADDNYAINDFESLVDGGNYTLGPPPQEQERQQPDRKQDISLAWEASVSTSIPDLLNLTSTDQICDFIFAPPDTPAAVTMDNFQLWKSVIPELELRRFFQPVDTGDSCEKMSLYISNLLIIPALIVGDNEDGYHSRIDQCVTYPMQMFAPNFKLRRNSTQDSSSYPLLRPDFSATILGRGCFFRGEEKKAGSNEDPQSELYTKLQNVWPFPGIPFVLGYYSVGTILSFSCVKSEGAEPVGNPLELGNALDRLKCWNAVRNVARVIKFVALHSTAVSPFDLQDVEKGSSHGTDWNRTISFSGGHVLKSIYLRDQETKTKLNRVLQVLALLKNGLRGVQPIISSNLSSSVADHSKRRKVPPTLYVVTAFGKAIETVESTAELRELIVFLLKTTSALNSLGITHRDIRLQNIVRNTATGELGLIDWDDSVKGLKNLPNADVAHLDQQSHALEMFIPGQTHDHTVDLWSVGFLIQQNPAHANNALTSLMGELLKPASQRPAITAALAMLQH